MIAPDTTTPKPPEPKSLIGIALVIATEEEPGRKTTLGVVFSPNLDKLKSLLKLMHSSDIPVDMTCIRAGEIKLYPDA